MNSKTADKRGFTLAELLIVVAIIAVVAAVAIPVFSSQLKKARLAADHAAIRDAYALVQIANNTEEVNVEGEIKTFRQLDAEEGAHSLYFLSKDCSSLIPLIFSSDKIYYLKATGSTEIGSDGVPYCPDCSQWDDIAGIYYPQSKMHSEGSFIAIVYSRTTHRLYLGMAS